MVKKLTFAFLAAVALVNPAAALNRDYYGQWAHGRRWHVYPNVTATLPYGWPMIAYTYVPATPYQPLPLRVYYIPQTEPRYNVPPYTVIAPY